MRPLYWSTRNQALKRLRQGPVLQSELRAQLDVADVTQVIADLRKEIFPLQIEAHVLADKPGHLGLKIEHDVRYVLTRVRPFVMPDNGGA